MRNAVLAVEDFAEGAASVAAASARRELAAEAGLDDPGGARPVVGVADGRLALGGEVAGSAIVGVGDPAGR
jgi:hypothetical protein